MDSKTDALYMQDNDVVSANATVLACFLLRELEEDLKPLFKGAPDESLVVVTDRTAFYAQGGGQPADAGQMRMTSSSPDKTATFTVHSVRKSPSGTILHVGTFEDGSFTKGDTVEQTVDAATRDLHSRIHDAGHIIGLAVHALVDTIGAVEDTKAQHYPTVSYVEFKGTIDGAHKAAIEAQANEIVDRDLPIQVKWWTMEESRARCWCIPEELVLEEDEKARAVDVPGLGAYLCGGTHMKTTGGVGKIEVKKISRSKGSSKISYAMKA
ncbi:Alanyl-tRNA editing protein AlaX-M-like protein [Emericellopsis cladophorae]|uniref:Alanyl-tRNA editing protein AlaX-M-like protein n=1 Tax=Emericellopsis cladophorae TaxID=2686198 RepID=A0A9Q0BE88_9HYPO|nr:Alanyl-tRNA editing protein AlaX-M-like protein [Emericellopsis cladophorae]KAI6782672.1 Alanyl-tRNA editing protein AlaX-M-like protein [Emericellopsis cladophorae]